MLRAAVEWKRDGLARKMCSAPDWRITTRPLNLPGKPVRGLQEIIPPAGAQDLCTKRVKTANFLVKFFLHSPVERRITTSKKTLVNHKKCQIEIEMDFDTPVGVW